MTAQAVLAQVQALGGRLIPKPPDRIRYELPVAPPPELLDAIRQAKPELLRLLAAPPDGPCPVPHPGQTGSYWWQTAPGGLWTCGRCQPDPRAGRWRRVTLATLGNRRITLTAPAGDLPSPREWAMTWAGVADLLCWTNDGAECLCRPFRPRPGQAELVWCGAGRVLSELAWSRWRQP